MARVQCFVSFASSAQTAPPAVSAAVMAEETREDARRYRFFTDEGAAHGNAGVTPYDLNTALSDGALKFATLSADEHATATYREDAPFEFPVGAAVLLKRSRSRLTWRKPGDHVRFWRALRSIQANGWQARGMFGTMRPDRGAAGFNRGDRCGVIQGLQTGTTWRIDWAAVPNRNQCTGCTRA